MRSVAGSGPARAIASGKPPPSRLVRACLDQINAGSRRCRCRCSTSSIRQLGSSGVPAAMLDPIGASVGTAPSVASTCRVRGLSRSGLVLSSHPVDSRSPACSPPNVAGARAVVTSGGKVIGRGTGARSPTVAGGRGDIVRPAHQRALFAQLRYAGPADMLWRLIGVETIDHIGAGVDGADIGGTPAEPSDPRDRELDPGGRLESATTGTMITKMPRRARSTDRASMVTSMSGSARRRDRQRARHSNSRRQGHRHGRLRSQTQNAQLLNRDDIGATVTGPITMTSGATAAPSAATSRS
jgi:translocation and assembly module TamB